MRRVGNTCWSPVEDDAFRLPREGLGEVYVSAYGVKAMAYFTDDTPQSVIDFAAKRLSTENVKTFQE
jgi:hypothetical protein